MANTNRTFLELQEAVQSDMQLNPGLISATERKQFINDALADLGKLNVFEKSDTLTSVDGYITTPSDYVSIITLRWVGSGRLLIPTRIPDSTIGISSNPIYYIEQGNTIELLPKPTIDGDVDMFYNYRPSKLVEDTDQPDVPNGYDNLLVDYAIAFCHRKNGEIGLFREYKSNYDVGRIELSTELLRQKNSRITIRRNTADMGLPLTPFDYL